MKEACLDCIHCANGKDILYICANEDGLYFGEPIFYADACEDWEQCIEDHVC